MIFLSDKFKQAVANKRQGMSLRDLAKEINISAATLNRVEKGNMPDLMTYAIICKWLGANMSQFLDESWNDRLKDVLRGFVIKECEEGVQFWGETMLKQINEL